MTAYPGIRAALLSGRERYEASKSPERRAAEERCRARKLELDREFEASESKRTSAPKPKATSATNGAPAKAAAKPTNTAYAEGLGKGFVTGRDLERARIREVAAVATERGQAIEGMRLLAETELSAADIVAKLKSRNLLVEAMKARHGEAAR